MIRRFCLHVRANKLQHNKGIWLPILYHELNKDDTILVQGWARDQLQTNESGTWHLWCETVEGEKIDPQVTLLDMDEIFYKIEYTKEPPENSEDNKDVIEQWNLYEKDPLQFWKTQTPEVRSFRSKIFSLVKKQKF